MRDDKVKIYHPEHGESIVMRSSLRVWIERGWSTDEVVSTSSVEGDTAEAVDEVHDAEPQGWHDDDGV